MNDKIKNMEDFASVCGISRPTLSKYFNAPDSVRKSTRFKIEAALEKFDYRPNIYAINQNRRQTKNIGLVVPNLTDPFFAGIARTIEGLIIDAAIIHFFSARMVGRNKKSPILKACDLLNRQACYLRR